jgi:hypothetical protein
MNQYKNKLCQLCVSKGHAPSVNIIQYLVRARLTMGENKIFLHPGHKVILKRAFDHLVQKIWCNQFVDVRTWEFICEWLEER